MGRGNDLVEKVAEKFDVLKQARIFFEPQLVALGLGKEQLAQQTIEELEFSLKTVEDAIKDPSAFGKLRFTASPMGGLIITSSATDSQFEVSILPILLERRKLILERLNFLKGEEEVANLQNLASHATQEDVREELKHQLEGLKADLKREQAQREEHAEVQELAELKAKLALAELQARAEIEMKKAKARSEIWQSYLARESVASIVGGGLLIVITVFLLIAMFFKLTAPDIISNSFLVILGYFFGQATGSILPHAKAKDEGSSREDDAPHKS